MIVVKGVFTDKKLSLFEAYEKEISTFKINDEEFKNVKPGDMLNLAGYSEPIEVLSYSSSDDHQGIVRVSLAEKTESNYSSLKNNKNMEVKTSVFTGIADRYVSMYAPQKESGIMLSMVDGTMVVPVKDQMIGVTEDERLKSYPIEMCIRMPIFYSINVPQHEVKKGDIIKNGTSYAYVKGQNADGSLKTLSFSGYTHNKAEIEDALMGTALVRKIINPFTLGGKTGFNPIMFALANGDKFDVKSLMALSMMPQGCNIFSKAGNGFNPMMLMMLNNNGSENSGDSGVLGMMMMSQMMGGNNMFGSMFGGNNTETKEETSTDSKDEKLKDLEKDLKIAELEKKIAELKNNNVEPDKKK